MFRNLYKIKYYQRKKGMTLIELLVVLAIFALITGIVMYDYGSFKSATSTQNLANDIALSVRKAQSYAIGVRGVIRGVNSKFQYGHGIHFSTNIGSEPYQGSNKSFVLFINSDTPRKNNYDPSNCSIPTEGECQEVLTISSADEILGFYLNDIEELKKGVLDIVFKRPNPDAEFCFIEEGTSNCLSDYSYVTIEVSNGQTGEKEITRKITVWSTGQIGVN